MIDYRLILDSQIYYIQKYLQRVVAHVPVCEEFDNRIPDKYVIFRVFTHLSLRSFLTILITNLISFGSAVHEVVTDRKTKLLLSHL